MLRATKYVVTSLASIPIIVVAAILLFWLGRPEESVAPASMPDFDPDDPGRDVDEDERTP